MRVQLDLGEPAAAPVTALSAEYRTRHIEGNGAFRLLMMGVDTIERMIDAGKSIVLFEV